MASVSGTQPPAGILVMLPATKMPSMQNSPLNSAPTASGGQPHWVTATKAPRMVVMNMVPTTAAP